jgi:hypothetical protein
MMLDDFLTVVLCLAAMRVCLMSGCDACDGISGEWQQGEREREREREKVRENWRAMPGFRSCE